jgi:hypothetical protein
LKKKKEARRNKSFVNDFELVDLQKPTKKGLMSEEDLLNGLQAPEPKPEQEPKKSKKKEDVEMKDETKRLKPIQEEDLQPKKPLTPQKPRSGIDTALVKDKLLKILNPKASGNRPSVQEERKSYSTEDLLQRTVTPLQHALTPRQEAMSQLISYNRLDEEEELTETEKDEDEEMLEQKRLAVVNNLTMNIYMFQKFIKW